MVRWRQGRLDNDDDLEIVLNIYDDSDDPDDPDDGGGDDHEDANIRRRNVHPTQSGILKKRSWRGPTTSQSCN